MQPQSLILLYHYFHPDDVVSARLFSDLAIEATRRGVSVTAMPSVRSCHDGAAAYKSHEVWAGGEIRRVWRPAFRQSSNFGRLVNALAMLIGWSWRALWTPRRRHEVMIVGTDPILSVLITIPWRIFRPSSTIVHWCHDVYPAAAIADGLAKPDALAVRVLNRILRLAYKRCDVIADLGECMRNEMLRASGAPEAAIKPSPIASQMVCDQNSTVADHRNHRSHVAEVPVSKNASFSSSRSFAADDRSTRRDRTTFMTVTPWALVESTEVAKSEQRVREELFGDAELGLLYSGNLGRAHQFEGFLELARRVRDSPLAFCYAGRGPRMDELRSRLTAEDSNIRLAAFSSESDLELRLAAADVHLVSLRECWTGAVVPSKFFGALAVGRPVLFAGSPQAAIAGWIERYRVGWVLRNNNGEAVADRLIAYAGDRGQRTNMNQRCWDIYQRHFCKQLQLEKLLDIGRDKGGWLKRR